METVAIVGTGIAGLGCAHVLRHRYALTLYERDAHIGGHAHTVQVRAPEGEICLDTGFMTFNHVTYPELTRLFRELDVPIQPSPMSFSVQHLPSGLEFSGSSLNHLFGQRRNLFKPGYWRMLLTIDRFNREAVQTLETGALGECSLGQYLEERGYGARFRDLYLLPMSCAVWSAPPERMLEFPAATLLRFFHNHGFLGLHTQHPWYTVSGGAHRYVERLVAPFRDHIHLRRGVRRVRRQGGGVLVTDESGHTAAYDRVVLACHADQALEMLADADGREHALLGQFRYQPNTAWLHTDASVMPRTPRCWSSWNYRVADSVGQTGGTSTVYWLNSLQRPPTKQNYFVSINGAGALRREAVLRRIDYEHPLFSLGAIRAQPELPALNRRHTGVYFCGSYFRYGFHEDALRSGLELGRELLGAAGSVAA